MKKLFLSTSLLALPLLASAYDALVDGIYYNLIPKAGLAEVTSGETKYSGPLTIPEKFTYEDVEYSVKTIGVQAFYNCSGLTSLTIPNSVTDIGNSAFYGCSGLTSLTIPNSVTDIGYWAFQNCSGLTSVTIPNSVTSIAGSAFQNCSGLTSISIPNSVTSIGSSTFSGCRGLTSVTIPNSVTSIGFNAFAGCSGLTSVTIPNSVTSIEGGTFYNCSGLTSVTIPNSVNSIGTQTFMGCSSLTSLTIPNSVTYIELEAFRNCSGLTSVTIGSSVRSIGKHSFLNCSKLEEVYCLAENVPGTSTDAFEKSYPEYTTLYVPASSLNAYKSTEPWSEFGTILPIEGYYYKLIFLVDDNLFKSYTWKEGDVITPEEEPTKEGYTFSGWSEMPETMPASDVTVTGSFSVNKYNLTYKVDGVDYKTTQIEYGSAITPEAIPAKEGYTFSGWSEIPETMPANDVTVTGTFTANKYKLTYMVDGEEYKASEVDYGTAITAEAVPTKEGYTFSGWSEIPSTMPANDLIITGTFVPNKYKLTYFVDGGEYKSSEIEFGSTITAEENPTKEGYTFSGWSEIPETMPASDVTITGSFTINKYKLTYTLDGEEYKTAEVDYGTALTPEEAPTKEGYTFSGWSEIPETMPANDVTVTGTFTANKYKLTFMVDGEEYKASEVDYGTAITAEAVPTKEGYTFSGWSDIPESMPANDVTVTGTFTVNKYKLTYMVDGEEYKTSEVDFGTAITAEAVPTKEGYTFSGWSTIPETMPASDVTITGTFTVNKYKLTYMVDGVEYKSYEVEYGASITPEASPANEGQTFSGWSEIPATMPAQDVVVTGTFSDNSYKLTYIVDGEVFKSSHVEYGSTITPETPPTKEGYTFSGWSDIPETMPAGDVTITGTFTINTYTITYMVDNALLTTEEVTYGSTITPPASPKEGYEITWNSHPTTMPAYDVTIYGSYISTGINGIYAEESDKKVYTPDGKRIQSPKKGMNIIRKSDGTIKKVVVK